MDGGWWRGVPRVESRSRLIMGLNARRRTRQPRTGRPEKCAWPGRLATSQSSGSRLSGRQTKRVFPEPGRLLSPTARTCECRPGQASQAAAPQSSRSRLVPSPPTVLYSEVLPASGEGHTGSSHWSVGRSPGLDSRTSWSSLGLGEWVLPSPAKATEVE